MATSFRVGSQSFTGRGAPGASRTPGLQCFAPYHSFGYMPSRSRKRPEPMTAEDDSGRGDDPDQCRDKLLLRLLKMPPQSRAETAERARRAKAKTSPQRRAATPREGRVHKGKTRN